jgi:hypothetical protein
MDANKLSKLRKIGYTIKECCGTCIHRTNFKGGYWSTCELHFYDHQKHTDVKRDLSIFIFGCCQNYKSAIDEFDLRGFAEFIKEST